MAAWDDQPLGAFGTASQVPTNEWFPVNTDTGQWGTQAPTLASDAGVNWAGIPDLIPTRTMAPSPMMGGFGGVGGPDQAPLAIGQVAGTMAPPMTTPRSMQRVQRLDEMGALTRQPGMWETIARSVGNLSPQGRQILQSSDQQQQQQLQNRLTMRRQALQEEQNERTEIRDDFNSLVKLSEVKSKKLRNLYADRLFAGMRARGREVSADMVEAFKSSGLDEGKAMVKFYEPLLTDLGLDPTAFAELVDQGGIKEVGEALTLAQKLKKDKTEQARLAALDKIGAGATLGDASGQAALATPGAQAPTGAPTAPAPGKMAPAPKEIEEDIAEAHRLYPQVRKDLIRAVMLQESYFSPDAKGSAGEIGLMQLKPGTAKDLGVDPYDRRQNVIGGTKYLAQHLTKYGGNEARALAAYNRGPGAVPTEGPIPEQGQSYAQQVLGHTTGGRPAGQPDTRMQVAGPSAPAPAGQPPSTASQPSAPTGGTPQEQAQLTAYNTRIATLENNIARATAIGGEEGRGRATAWERQRDNLAKERDRLQDRLTKEQDVAGAPARALEQQRLLEPGRLREQEAGRALTPISDVTQKSLATNKSIYRSIGKVEEYLREGTDLPADFVNLVAEDAPGISAWLQSDPKNITGLAKQWETKFKAVTENDPRANRFLAALGNMRDLVIRERSGGSVTGNELDRAMGAFLGSLPNINQAFSLFAQNLANVKETVMDELVTSGAAARPLSGGKAMYGTLPKEIRDRIDYAERGEDYPKAKMPTADTTTTTTTTTTPPKPPPGAKLGGPIVIVKP